MTTTNVAVVDYGMGNLRSVAKMLTSVGARVCITSDPDDIRRADKIIVPGVGSFPEAKANLEELNILEVLEDEVRTKGKDYLGICLGMQLLATESSEGGLTRGLDWIHGRVEPLVKTPGLRIPHMGWNHVDIKKTSKLFLDFYGNPTFYFVHSYNMVCEDEADILATSDYGGDFTSAVQKGNIFGMQFHPEKSQAHGRILIENFLDSRG